MAEALPGGDGFALDAILIGDDGKRGQRGEEPFLEEICAESNFNFGLFDFHMPVATTADF
jgi:hypothetical protein